MTRKNFIQLLKTGISCYIISLTFIPYGQSFLAIDNCIDDDCWVTVTLFSDIESIIVHGPYLLLTLLHLWILPNAKWLKILLFILSSFLLVTDIFLFGPLQDFIPDIGAFMLIALHFFVFIKLLFESKIRKLIDYFFQ